MDCTTLDNTIETPTVTPVMVAPNATTPSTLTPIPGDFSDSAIPSYIRDFLAAVKPDDTSTLEIAYVVLLLSHKACDHEVTFSHPEFAQRLGCKDVRTVKSAEESLVRRGWITVTPRRGMSNLTAVRIDRLPMVTAALPRKPSDAAQLLTRRYLNVLLQLRAKGSKPAPQIPHKKQIAIMEWTAQKMLNRSNGDVELVADKITFAISHPTLKNYARQGLYKLWKRWAQVEREFAAQKERIKEQTQ